MVELYDLEIVFKAFIAAFKILQSRPAPNMPA